MKLWIDKELFQWERDRYVYVSLTENDPQITYIQFYNERSSISPEIPLENNRAEIPAVLLQQSLPIMAVACIGQQGRTQVIGRRQFKVIKRAKPENYENTGRYVIYDGGEEV